MKKNFVRVIALALAVMMVAFAFAACKKGIDGTYTVKKINDKDVKAYFTEIAETTGVDFATALQALNLTEDKLDSIMNITLNADGTGTIESAMTGAKEDIKWEQKDDVITITDSKDQKQEVTVKDGNLILKLNEEMTFTLGK